MEMKYNNDKYANQAIEHLHLFNSRENLTLP